MGIKVLEKKDFPDEIGKFVETVINYIPENDVHFMNTEFTDKWNYPKENFSYLYDYFHCLNDY